MKEQRCMRTIFLPNITPPVAHDSDQPRPRALDQRNITPSVAHDGDQRNITPPVAHDGDQPRPIKGLGSAQHYTPDRARWRSAQHYTSGQKRRRLGEIKSHGNCENN